MSTNPSTELQRTITAIKKTDDVVDLLTVLLKICRKHAGKVMGASRDPDRRSRREELKRDTCAKFTSKALTQETRDFVIEKLTNSTLTFPETARGLALGIDLAMRQRFPTAYRELLRRNGRPRQLLRGDPYPTPVTDLKAMYGADASLTREPRASSDATSFDSVDGLSLWDRRSGVPCRVIYDPRAGRRLDAALQGSTVAILSVSPNDSVREIHFPSFGPATFFGIHPKQTVTQDGLMDRALAGAATHKAQILVTPELSDTANTVTKCATSPGAPPIVIAGGAHLTLSDGKRVNRLSTIYTGRKPLVVPHDKIGRYSIKGLNKQEWEEDLYRGEEVCLHAGTEWSMIVLICADFMEKALYRLVADLCPRLVIVASMTAKTVNYRLSAGTVINECQALVVVANGPPDWSFNAAHPGIPVPVAIVGMPLDDPIKLTRDLTPPSLNGSPYAVLVESLQASAKFVSI